MQPPRIAVKNDDTEKDSGEDQDLDSSTFAPVSVPQEKPEQEPEIAKSIAFVLELSAKDPDWASYSRNVRGCITTRVAGNGALGYKDTVHRCKYIYDE
ncbi:MAG: hypothetical protein QX199_18180 [Methylococcaceae bacterium]